MELWEKVQNMLKDQKKAYPKYAKRQQPINYLLKGLVRCDNCGGTLALASAISGKSKVRTMQCCNYSRGSCTISHSITIPRIETAFINGLKQAVNNKQFTIIPKVTKETAQKLIDYDKLIAIEERRLARAKEAFLAEIDTLDQYGENKKEITEKIKNLKAKKVEQTSRTFNPTTFAQKVSSIVQFIEREDVTAQAKNEALHTIIDKIVYEKAINNLAIYFHDL